MKLTPFDFELPDDLIAKFPLKNRDDSRLMVVNRAEGTIDHHTFKDITSFFKSGDLLVLNNSKVSPQFMFASKAKSSAKLGVLLLRRLDESYRFWDAQIEFSRKIRVGNKICFENDLVAEVIDNTTSGGRSIRFSYEGDSDILKQMLEEIGLLPIPKKLDRPTSEIDQERYQTVYARVPGAVVAPAAGFHFTPYILKYLELQGILTPSVTLHKHINTFKFIASEELNKYKIHSEYYNIPSETSIVIEKALKDKQKICAVGTSTWKALESPFLHKNSLQIGEGWTNKFICPPYQPTVASVLLTNFHLPRSVDFVNTLAFAGHDLAMEAYAVAIEEGYRFFVYGDALLIT